MTLVVSSLTGDASDVFDWICSLNPGNTEDLTALLTIVDPSPLGNRGIPLRTSARSLRRLP